MGIANDLMDAVHEAQAIAAKAGEQRDELAAALRELIQNEDDYGDSSNVAVNQALEKARNVLAKFGGKA